MLQEIRIRGLGVIADAVLELSPGLNVLTGETGAGKTMVVSGLDLLLGARADASLVREGDRAATIEGLVVVERDHAAAVRALEAGAEVDDEDGLGSLILARSISAEGRSRAHVGGRVAPVGVLSDLGQLLVAVHGQADQWRLRRPDQHRVLLDRYAGDRVAVPLSAYTQLYARLHAARAEQAEVSTNERERVRELVALRTGLEEIEAAAPLPQEDVLLREEDERLSHADELRGGAGLAHTLLTGEGGGDDRDAGDGGAAVAVADVSTLLAQARAALLPMSGHDPGLSALADRLQELGYLAADLGGDLAAYLADIDADPGRLAWVQQRRAELGRLQRSYGDSVDDVLEWARASAVRVARLEHADEQAAVLQERIDRLEVELGEAADRLTTARRAAAGELEREVTQELRHLAMGSASVQVCVSPSVGGPVGGAPGASGAPGPRGVGGPTGADGTGGRSRFGPYGADEVEILLATRPGGPARSVARAASGGELSRLMLALEVVSNSGDVPTFVFDEVDAGIGGAAALDVGARLARLAAGAQVIVVTHLAQVAAYADRHLVVQKSDGRITASGVAVVDGDERVRELARMMAGAQTPVALAHARELLTHAATGAGATAGPSPAKGAGASSGSGPAEGAGASSGSSPAAGAEEEATTVAARARTGTEQPAAPGAPRVRRPVRT